MIHLELFTTFLLLVGVVVLLSSLFDSVFPVFKYSLLSIKITTYFILTVLLVLLIYVIRSWRKRLLKTLSNHRKITYSVICLSVSFIFLSSIEYLIYIQHKDKFNIDDNYTNALTKAQIFSVRQEIEHCKRYVNTYNHIYKGLKNKEYVEYHRIDDCYYTVINGDSIELNIQRRQMPGTGTLGITRIDKGIDNAESIGISLKDESYNLSHPRSNVMLESMQKSNNINGDELRLLVSQKIEMYQDRIEEYKKILQNEVVITFGDFVIYNVFNPNITDNKTHIFIRLIFFLQAIVVTFFSGYIYQTFYKILDGEEFKGPKA